MFVGTHGLTDTANSTNKSMANTDNTMADSMPDSVADSMGKTVSNNICRVGGSAIVGHLSDVSINIVGVVVDVLDTAVREVDGVGALSGRSAVVSLGSIEPRAGVVVSHGVLVGVGGDLIRVHLHRMGDTMAHKTMGNTMVNANTMANADTMANANTMANTNTMTNAYTMASNKATMSSHKATMASQELARGSSHKGRDADEGLREESGDGEKEDEDENSWLLYLHVRAVDLRLVTSSILWELIW